MAFLPTDGRNYEALTSGRQYTSLRVQQSGPTDHAPRVSIRSVQEAGVATFTDEAKHTVTTEMGEHWDCD